MTELRTGLVAATPGTIAIYMCEARKEMTFRTVLAYRWDDLDGGGWVECVGDELGLVVVDHIAPPGWTYAGLAHINDLSCLEAEITQDQGRNAGRIMTAVKVKGATS